MVEIGKVQWFDKKKGYGFVKIVDPESDYHNTDVFVHYTSIVCESDFKILYPGETVSMNVEKNSDGGEGKEFVTSNVTGIFGTSLIVDNPDFGLRIIKKRSRNTDADPVSDDDVGEEGDGDEIVS